MGEVSKRILLATGQEAIDREIKKQNNLILAGNVPSREMIESQLQKTYPDIVLIGEGLPGQLSLPSLILDASGKYPNTRFIYLAGEVPENNEAMIEPIKMLLRAGIYDIVHKGQIKKKTLIELLNNPKDKEEFAHLLEVEESRESFDNAEVQVEYEELKDESVSSEESDLKEVEKKIFVISSIKPGTGKSFLAVNLATAIAKYGVNKADGSRPKVALIEADLQNLSLGTLLQIDEKDNNLLKAMDLTKRLLKADGDLVDDEDLILDINRDIRKCFVPYSRVKNLDVLTGSHLQLNDLKRITNNQYKYLVQAMKYYYDIVIVDANSSLDHISSRPILEAADSCYFVLNLDFNNVLNNTRYQEVLKQMRVMDKVKYVLNEDVQDEISSETLDFTREDLEDSGFKLEACIPSIPKTIFNNRLYQGTPIILGDEKETQKARNELLKIANQIYSIMNYSANSGEELIKKKRLGFRK